MTPRSEALAFRIWQYADPLGWDCTSAEIAEALGEPTRAVARVCGLKGWCNRLRSSGLREKYLANNIRPRMSPDEIAADSAPAKLNADRLHDLGVL